MYLGYTLNSSWIRREQWRRHGLSKGGDEKKS